ncbi:MAG: glycerophosphodiester phosphodiesterase [Proteobacteria bacterium]|nr:glycerophosphodiester phosphodiesterase [Pseudomonadota bacterium]
MINTLFGRMRNNWKALLQVHLIFSLLGTAILGPLFGLLLQFVIEFSGYPAASDQDIALLLLTPLGMVSVLLLASTFLAIGAVEIGALMAIAVASQYSIPSTSMTASRYAITHMVGLLRLTLQLTLKVLQFTIPLVLIVGLIFWIWFSESDINYYLSHRPPEFMVAVVIVLLLGLTLLGLIGYKLLRWCLALPLVLFGNQPSGSAMRESEQLTAGQLGRLVTSYFSFLAVAVLAGAIVAALLDVIGGWIVAVPYQHLPPLVFMLGSLVAAWLAINFFISAMILSSVAFVTAELYAELGPTINREQAQDVLQSEQESSFDWTRKRVALTFVAIVAVAGIAGVWLWQKSIGLPDQIAVIAHRGAAGAAPENTLAAVRRAIIDGADWVEIDVQETRDGHVVVVHDSDFMKLSRNPLKVWDGDLETIQKIDVGSWFGPEFVGETVPTLAQVLDEVKGQAKLLIELKYYGHDEDLEQRVVDIVESADMVEQVAFMSLKLQGVEKIQALRPQWDVGLLAATSVGDLSKMDVDFLALGQGAVTSRFIKRSHSAGKRVLVWTINDALSLNKWMSMGVDGVITDEPALAGQVLKDRQQMSSAERLLLSAALFFGKPMPPSQYRDNSP